MKPIKILLIEDNEGDILLTKEALVERKITNEIDVAKDGEQALNLLLGAVNGSGYTLPDLIILDINLPKLNGHEILQKVKTTEGLKKIPVIMLTTSSSEKDISMSYQHHANCFVTKPVEVDKFLEAIGQIQDFWLNIVKLPK
jgi:CheY-like chemotaxis protein